MWRQTELVANNPTLALGEPELYELTEIPRPARGPDRDGDPGRLQRAGGLVAAYHLDEPFAMAWARFQPDGPIHVLVGGRAAALEGSGGAGSTAVRYPPGARGHPLPAGDLWARCRALGPWASLRLVPDALARLPTAPPGEAPRIRLEDVLVLWRAAFAWLLIGLPVPAGEIARLAGDASHRLRRLRATAASSQDDAVEAERLEGRHRELRQAESTGLWRVCVVAGAQDVAAARRVSALVAGSADLYDLPYVLAPGGETGHLDAILASCSGAGPAFGASTEAVAALARPPAVEVPGLRLVLQPAFDVTPEAETTAGPSVVLGQTLDRFGAEAGPLRLTLESLNRHTFVCGATGAGKSQTTRSLLERLTAAGIPWLVVEPAKAEYARIGGAPGLGRPVIVIRPGEADAVAPGVNPLEPEPGFHLQTHADLVRALFLAAFEAEEPFPQVLAAALTRCYEEQGWDLVLGASNHPGRTPRYPSLADLQRVARAVVEGIGYGPEVTQDVRGFVEVRLGSLRTGTAGRFFQGGHPLDFARLLASDVVLEIEDVGDDRDKAFLMGTVLLRLVEHLRVRERARSGAPPVLGHVSVFEEAHRLLRRSQVRGPAAHAVELFASLLAEVRAYGEGLIVVEQIPSKLVPDVIKNSAVKIVHRLPAGDDRQAVGETMHMTPEQSDYVVTLPPGTAAVFSDGMDYPLLARMPDGLRRQGGRPTPSADPLVGRFSAACGDECRARACTLREMREAERTLGDRTLALWAELAVVGHITGWPVPEPGPLLRAALGSLPRRRRECAIAQAVSAAVDGRAGALLATMTPAELGAHVAQCLRAQLDGLTCPSPEARWLGLPYRWSPLRRELRDFLDAQSAGRPAAEPDVAVWEAAFGVRVPGQSPQERFQHVVRWSHADRADHDLRRRLLLGAGDPSSLERAVGCRHGEATWKERFEGALEPLRLELPWPVAFISAELGVPRAPPDAWSEPSPRQSGPQSG
jgi:hypothetical protein